VVLTAIDTTCQIQAAYTDLGWRHWDAGHRSARGN
jgi:hypothetical protein